MGKDTHAADNGKSTIDEERLHNREHIHMHELSIILFRHKIYDHSDGLYSDSTKPRKLAIQDFRLDSEALRASPSS